MTILIKSTNTKMAENEFFWRFLWVKHLPITKNVLNWSLIDNQYILKLENDYEHEKFDCSSFIWLSFGN
jgi:hypothetical protein